MVERDTGSGRQDGVCVEGRSEAAIERDMELP